MNFTRTACEEEYFGFFFILGFFLGVGFFSWGILWRGREGGISLLGKGGVFWRVGRGWVGGGGDVGFVVWEDEIHPFHGGVLMI